MAFDASPASPAAEDPPADDAMDAEPEGKEEAEAEEKQEEAEEQEEEEEEESQTERKRGRRKKGSAEKPAPATPTVERPSRERKTVERYAELTPRVTPAKKASAILQGAGTKLKDIPNGKGKGSTAAGSTPTTKQLHAVVSDILNPQPFSVSGRWQSAMTAAAEADGGRKADVLVRDDVPKLLAALKEMKDGLDLVRSKVESLTRKVRKNQLPTCDGIGYLEAKHHLLLSYCQGLVYYLLRKAKGLSVDGHPVVCSLVEIRLFLEKIRAIDKKMEYQIQKLTNAAEGAAAQEKVLNAEVKGKGEQRGEEDLLKYRPNPDMMDSKFAPDGQDNDGLYRPPKFVPASMDDKHQKDASRRDRALARMATENPYIKEIIDDAADRPEEWKETVGDESKEFVNYMQQREKQEKQEEELFTRAPVTKREKYMEKQMKEQLHGLRGLTDGFDLGMNMLLDGDKEDGGGSCEPHSKSVGRRKHQKGKKRKRH